MSGEMDGQNVINLWLENIMLNIDWANIREIFICFNSIYQ